MTTRTSDAAEPIQARSPGPTLIVVVGLAIAAGVFYRDYAEPGMEHLSEGLLTEQVFGLFGAFAFAIASVVAFIALPERLYVAPAGLVSVRGVLGTWRRTLDKERIQAVSIAGGSVRKYGTSLHYYDVWAEFGGRSKRLRRFPSEKRDEATALATSCSTLWEAELVPAPS